MWRSEWGNIRSLQEQLDAQFARSDSAHHRVSSQLSKLQGDLSQRVDRLSRSFDAFVELSEIRHELALFLEARRWRTAARDMVEGSVAGDQQPSSEQVQDLADVEGYWLVPALRALPGVVSGHPDRDLLASAAQRDEARSTMFLAAASVMMARTEVVAGWVGRAMSGAPASPVTTGQRALWLAAADGEMAHTAIEAIRSELRRRLDGGTEVDRARLVVDLAALPPGSVSQPKARSTASSAAATEMLRRWAGWCHQLTTRAEVERVIAPAHAATHAPAHAATTSASGSDAVLDLVRSLVEEGSPDEQPLLDRADDLLAIVEGTIFSPLPEWNVSAGTVVSLLAADLRDTSDPRRARFALALLGDQLESAADELVRQAQVPPDPTLTVEGAGSCTVTIDTDGAGAQDVAAAEAVLRHPQQRRIKMSVLYAGIASVTLFVGLGILTSSAWFVLAALLSVALVGIELSERRNRAAAARSAELQVERLHKRIADAQAQLNSNIMASAAAAAEAVVLRAQIDEALLTVRRQKNLPT